MGDELGLIVEEDLGDRFLAVVSTRRNTRTGGAFSATTAPFGSPVMADEVRGDAEEPGTGVGAVEVVGRSGPERRDEGLAHKILGVRVTNPLQDVPVYRPCVPGEKDRERVRITERSIYVMSIGPLSRPAVAHQRVLPDGSE